MKLNEGKKLKRKEKKAKNKMLDTQRHHCFLFLTNNSRNANNYMNFKQQERPPHCRYAKKRMGTNKGGNNRDRRDVNNGRTPCSNSRTPHNSMNAKNGRDASHSSTPATAETPRAA
jgi:hypothetical protein